ncbi:MAG TPA: hypothetical protein CFH82_06395 [Sulfurospirillum sp. UBA12182]|jgi:hypothetical protein|nr:MAG TPA: hypothetical protein CFH82_06395 [Sulfurospirillum sp. UBA12182]
MLEIVYHVSLFTIIVIIYFIVARLIYEINHPIAKYIKKIILSDIPFFQLSHDEKFHTIENDYNPEKIKYRFSLLMIPFGSYKIYFFTWREKFDFIYLLSLKNIISQKIDKTKTEIDNFLQSNYHQYDSKWQNISIEILKDDINVYNDSKNTARTKGTFYVTLVAAFISIIFTQLNDIKCFYTEIVDDNLILKVLFYYLVILLTNMIIFNLQSMSVSTFIRETYDDFIDGTINYSKFKFYYSNMKWTELFSQMHVSYVKNVELFLHRSLLIMAIITILYIFIGGSK